MPWASSVRPATRYVRCEVCRLLVDLEACFHGRVGSLVYCRRCYRLWLRGDRAVQREFEFDASQAGGGWEEVKE